MTSRWTLALVVAVTVACRSAAPAASPRVPVPPAPAVAGKPAPSSLSTFIRWTRDSAEHRALFLQVYRAATALVESAAAARAPGTWGVVLDADETVRWTDSLYPGRAGAARPIFRPRDLDGLVRAARGGPAARRARFSPRACGAWAGRS